MDYETLRDPHGEITFKARCVSGDDEECGAESDVSGSDEAANKWMAEHTAGTGHKRFKRTFEDYALVERKP
ncbi:hypothetical protein [Streptomyces sp. Ag109_G2-15]|uniref:DUF7848 domain-containing protein n=1 Tax=Streptomyces sp. Ag109_G2-15 TaxID=1938850 RepID=UPI00117DFD86|nr:hypothetical protein [Streptomyces sp. Ag109_G2-15]